MNRRDKTLSYRVRFGFTLIEVLVVVAIIALLVAVILPSLKRAREEASGVVCRSNMHQFNIAVHAYVADGRALPATNSVFWTAWETSGRPGGGWPNWKPGDSWLGLMRPDHAYNTAANINELHALWAHVAATVPRMGSLYRFTKEDKLYLCPKDKQGQADPKDPRGGGGNGRFSYTMNGFLGFKTPEQLGSFRYVADFEAKSGALQPKRPLIPAGTQVIWPASKMVTFIEEHPWNNTNHGWVGDSWGADSYMAMRHDPQPTSARCNFAFLDGHAEARRYPYFVINSGGGGFGQGGGWDKVLGVDLFNEYQFPYSYDGNRGGATNERAFVHQFPYPYR